MRRRNRTLLAGIRNSSRCGQFLTAYVKSSGIRSAQAVGPDGVLCSVVGARALADEYWAYYRDTAQLWNIDRGDVEQIERWEDLSGVRRR